MTLLFFILFLPERADSHAVFFPRYCTTKHGASQPEDSNLYVSGTNPENLRREPFQDAHGYLSQGRPVKTPFFHMLKQSSGEPWKVLPSGQDFQRHAEEKDHQDLSTTRSAGSEEQS